MASTTVVAQPSPVTIKSFTNNNIQISISGSIKDASDYQDIFEAIRNAGEADVIDILINSPGGYVGTAVQFKHILENTPATTRAHLEAECHSAATIIALACDELVVHPHALMLIHTYSGGGWGKSADLVSSVMAQDTWIKTLMKTSYEEFLSPKEIEALFEGKDYWIDAKDISARWENVMELRRLHHEEAIKEQEEAIREQAKNL